MKVLIIGGMGVIGGAVTEAAIKKGYDVTVLSRRYAFEKWTSIPARYVQGDWKDDTFAERLLSDSFDVIVDTLIFNEKQMERSLNIINHHCKHFIYISTDSVYPHPSKMCTENVSVNIADIKWKYGINKMKGEIFLQSHSEEYSFNWSVVRPTITFGDNRIPVGFASKRGTYTIIDRIEKQKPIIRFDDPESRHSLCHSSIFGNALVNLFLNEGAYGRLFHISDDYSYTYGEIFDAIESIVGIKVNYVFMSAEILKKYNKPLYYEMIYDKNPYFTLDNTCIKSLCLGTNFHVNINDALQDTILFLMNHRNGAGEDTEYNMLTDLLLFKIKNKLRARNNEHFAYNYVNNFTDDYIRKIKQYGLKAQIKNCERTVRKTLGSVKIMILKVIKKMLEVVELHINK